MKVTYADDAEKFKNSGTCRGASFGTLAGATDLAVIEVDGRYPGARYLKNEVCKEVVYILQGGGALLDSNNHAYAFVSGDAVFIDSNEEFAWEGDFRGVFSSTPAFYPEQHKEVAA